MEPNPFGIIPSRTSLLTKIKDLVPDLPFSVERAVVDPVYGNRVYEEALLYLKMKPALKRTGYRQYAITLTTQVVNGVAKKNVSDFKATLDRILELRGVTKIEGNFELTQQGALHIHCIATVTLPNYLDSNKVRRANMNEHCVVQLLRNEKHVAGTERYCRKDENDPKTLLLLCPIFTSTRFSLPAPAPLSNTQIFATPEDSSEAGAEGVYPPESAPAGVLSNFGMPKGRPKLEFKKK